MYVPPFFQRQIRHQRMYLSFKIYNPHSMYTNLRLVHSQTVVPRAAARGGLPPSLLYTSLLCTRVSAVLLRMHVYVCRGQKTSVVTSRTLFPLRQRLLLAQNPLVRVNSLASKLERSPCLCHAWYLYMCSRDRI